MADDNQRETFGPTSGRVVGVLGLLVGLALVVVGLVASPVVWGLAAAGVLLAALAWTAMLRPLAGIDGDVLVLRGMLDTVRIPLAAIEEVSVRQVLAVRAGDKRYTSPAVGRTRRQMFRDDRGGLGGASTAAGVDAVRLAEESYGLFVEERIRTLATDARERQGVGRYSREHAALASGIERRFAVPELVVLATAVVGVTLAVVL